MTTFKGQINLISMADVAESVNTLKEVETYYAASLSGVVPPVGSVSLKIDEEGIVSVSGDDNSFIVKEGILTPEINGTEEALTVIENYIVGKTVEWTKEIPEVPKGAYLWTKTVYIYTDGSTSIHYSSSYHGADGEKGEDANGYFLRVNKTEVLKFIDEDGMTTISSDNLRIGFAKYDSSKELGYDRIQVDQSYLSIQIISLKDSSQMEVESNFISNDEYEFVLDLKAMIEYGNTIEGVSTAAGKFVNEDCIISITYNYEETDGKRYNTAEYVSVRYGMTKDMAQLSVNAADIVASINDAELKFSGSGLQIKNGNFVIVDSDGQELLCSEGGHLKLKGVIQAEGGYFNGDISGASGTFSGQLAAEGGYFKGRIEAEEGFFNGEIKALGGSIGGFEITRQELIATGGQVVLNGSDGSIYADNITLGTNAKIGVGGHLQIGDTVTLNSISEESEKFLIVTKPNTDRSLLTINGSGVIRIGDGSDQFVIDGLNGEIRAGNYAATSGWSISNGSAVFNNITARGSIKASVLEYGEVQTVGGMVLIRPSSRILSIEKINIQEQEKIRITVERVEGFKVDDICLVNKEGDYIYEPIQVTEETFNRIPLYYLENDTYVLANEFNTDKNYFSKSFAVLKKCFKIIGLDYENKSVVVDVNDLDDSYIGYPLVSLGNNSDEKLPVGIGINASENGSLLMPESLSVFEFNGLDDSGTPQLESKIILGKLPNISDYGYAAGSYGLYAENVILKGSLVTSTESLDGNSLTYSGINTIYSQGQSPTSDRKLKEYTGNCGEILLWAGALGTSIDEIEESKFFVDRNGNLYAGSGYFEGTIITKSKIKASEIETAILRGSNDELNEPALKIEDATKGIHFVTKDSNNEDRTVFEVSTERITANVDRQIDLNGFVIQNQGSIVVPTIHIVGNSPHLSLLAEDEGIQALILEKNRVVFTSDFKESEMNTTVVNSYIDFANDNLVFAPDGINEVFDLTKDSVNVNTTLAIKESIKYGEKMTYKPITEGNTLVGYDLYIE